jgi:hypothetical protein
VKARASRANRAPHTKRKGRPRPMAFLRAAQLDATAYKAKLPFLSRFGLTVASTAALVSPPLRNACFSAAANAWLAAISFSRSLAGSSGIIGGPNLLWWP